MALFPNDPVPSSVSAPAIIDPLLRFSTDSGVETVRALHSRPLRRFVLEYNGKLTQEVRIIRDFLQECRFGALDPIAWSHPTAYDLVPFSNTTPIILTYAHGMVTGQYINIGFPAGLAGFWQVTRLNPTQISLNGTSAGGGTGTCTAIQYLHTARATFSEDTIPEPTKIVGADRIGPDRPGEPFGAIAGRFSFSVTLMEIF